VQGLRQALRGPFQIQGREAQSDLSRLQLKKIRESAFSIQRENRKALDARRPVLRLQQQAAIQLTGEIVIRQLAGK